MEDFIKDDVIGELKYLKSNNWGKRLDCPVLNSDGNLILKVQDPNKEGILNVQREAYKTYLQNEEKYKSCVTDLLLDYYKWNYEYIARTVNNLPESCQKDIITEKDLLVGVPLWYLFICRDGSFGYAFGCCWDVDNGLAVLLSESEPRVISRTQLENLHKLNDPTVGLLVHDGKNAWKGLEINSFFGKPENLEIELEGSAEEGITEAQQKAYAEYMSKKEAFFAAFSKILLTIYTGSEAKAEEMQSLRHTIHVITCLPKTLYIDRNGNYGWHCYTSWNNSYIDVLLSEDRLYIMQQGYLRKFSKENHVVDKEMGIFFEGSVGLSSTIIVRIGSAIRTFPFVIEFFDDKKDINDNMRTSYRNLAKFNETFWYDLQDWSYCFYKDNYEELESYYDYDVPESKQMENIDKDSVMSLMSVTKLYMTNNGRIAWLCEYPTAYDGLAFEFTNGKGILIPQPQII